MIDIEEKSRLKYLLFGSLYFAEGIEIVLATVIIPVYLVDRGFSLSITTLVAALVMTPWILKFVFGGIVDYFRHWGRKRFILFGGLTGVICLFIISVIDPGSALLPFAFFLVVGHCGIAFMDVSADAWAIEQSVEEERGKINGFMYAGFFTGMAVGSSVIGFIASSLGYGIAFIVAGLFILAFLVFPALIREISVIQTRQKIIPTFVSEFKRQSTQMVSLFALISVISFGLLEFAVPLYMKTVLELDIGTIGLITAILPITTVCGCVVGGYTTDRWGRKINLNVFILASIFFVALLVAATNWYRLALIYGIIGFFHGGHYSAACALLMDVTNPKVGATQYSMLTSIANVGEMSGGMVSGSLISAIGFSRVFLFAGWIYGPALLILYFVRLKAPSFIRKPAGVVEDAA